MRKTSINKKYVFRGSQIWVPNLKKTKILYFYYIEKSAEKSNFNIDSICQGNIGTIFHHYFIVNIIKCLQICVKDLVDAREKIGGLGKLRTKILHRISVQSSLG